MTYDGTGRLSGISLSRPQGTSPTMHADLISECPPAYAGTAWPRPGCAKVR